MIKHFLGWGNQERIFGDFIGLAFVTALITMALCLSFLILVDLINKCDSVIDQLEKIVLALIFKTRQLHMLQSQ